MVDFSYPIGLAEVAIFSRKKTPRISGNFFGNIFDAYILGMYKDQIFLTVKNNNFELRKPTTEVSLLFSLISYIHCKNDELVEDAIIF